MYFGTNPEGMSELPWKTVKDYEEITFKVHEGVARIAFNRLKSATHSHPRLWMSFGKP